MVSSSSARAARERAKQLRAEQERKERRGKIARRSILGAGCVTIVGGAAGLVFYERSQKGEGGGANGKSTSAVDYTKLDETTLKSKLANRKGVPKLVLVDGSLPFGKGPVPGTMNAGTKNVIEIVFDYACSHCAEFESVHAAELKSIIDTGKATVVLRPCKILGAAWSDLADSFMGTVLDREPAKAWAMHTAIFAQLESAIKSGAQQYPGIDAIVSAANAVGLKADTITDATNSAQTNAYEGWTKLGTTSFTNQKLAGTPTVFINGVNANLAQLQEQGSLQKLLLPGATITPAPTNAAH